MKKYEVDLSAYIQAAVVLIIVSAMILTGEFNSSPSKIAATSLLTYAVSLVLHFSIPESFTGVTHLLLWITGSILTISTLVSIWL